MPSELNLTLEDYNYLMALTGLICSSMLSSIVFIVLKP